ncbi:PREDICTED: zinc-finger homeodomain protein 6-like [Tarenaya hassleriana]|uniref:zinc-finger homeodomain protein 6-like n=1 Tax=Tarenaya hassleriana TaxID=28532 RepID=UPI00053C18FD|nr:PREDICTED: zinc-finger homeodomain protein 6-like [Tarenaya hassleriana]XP_010531037.1 PREDICTED: zinc-finger homeodomain protein 6-like [Tarenaya hassleriana]
MEMGEKEREMEMPSSFRYYTSSTDHHGRRKKQATDHQTLYHHHHRPPPPPPIHHGVSERSKPTSRDSDPNLNSDSEPEPVSATPVSPLPRSHARPSPPSHLHHHLRQQKVRYRECQRNHAANSGGHVVDGCGEFMPAGEGDTPESLRCAASDCHRSFHRREVDGELTLNLNTFGHYNVVAATGKVSSQRNQVFPPPRKPPPPPLLLHHHASPIMMSFGGGGGGGPAESSTEDLNKFHQSLSANGIDQLQQPRKRFRTKFNQEQKEKMQEFADKIGWRITKQDDEELQRFCSQINVRRQVFKVWMHNNNKQAAARKKQM